MKHDYNHCLCPNHRELNVIVMHISGPLLLLLLLLCTYPAHSFHHPLHDFALGKLPPGRQNGSQCSHPMDVNGGAEAGAGCNRNNSGIIRGPFTSSSPELCQNGGTAREGPSRKNVQMVKGKWAPR